MYIKSALKSTTNFTNVGIVLFLLIGLGKIAAFLRDIVISNYFGIDYKTDAYFVATQIPNLIYFSLFSTVTLVFLPLYNSLRVEEGFEISAKFANNALIHYSLLALFLSGCGVLFAKELVYFLAPLFNQETSTLAVSFTRILCLSFVFSMIVGILTSIQYAYKLVIGPQLVSIISNAAVIIGTLLFYKKWGLYAVAVSAVVGWVIQVPIQRMLLGSSFSFRWNMDIGDKNLRRMAILIVPAFLGVSIDQVNVIIDNSIGSGLLQGSISALNYGMRLMNFCSSFFIVIITAIIFPLFSDYVVKKDVEALNVLLNRSLRGFTLVALPIILISVLFSETIISIIYMRGAFDSNDVQLTSIVFVGYIVAIVFVFFRELLNRVFYAHQSTIIPMYISGVSIIFNYALSIYLAKSIGAFGLALATSISILVYVVLQFIFLSKKTGVTFFYSELIHLLIKTLLATFVMFLFFHMYFELVSIALLFVNLVVACSLGLMIYIITLYLLKVREIDEIKHVIRNKFVRRNGAL